MSLYPCVINDQNQLEFIGAPVPTTAFPAVAPMVSPMLPAPMIPLAPMANPLPGKYDILENQILPAGEPSPLFWDNGNFVECPSTFQLFNGNGERVCPPGYTFVLMDVPVSNIPVTEQEDAPRQSSTPSPALSYGAAPSRSPPSISREPSVPPARSERPTAFEERSVNARPVVEEEKPQKNRKFRHRSKQERITQIHEMLRIKYTHRGLYAGNDEVLRGFDTVRVHVKTYHALGKIEEALDEVERHERVRIKKIATPFSMKNRFQKKGFIVYLKLHDENMVPYVQDVFALYSEHFNKCDLALKKEQKIAMQEAANKALSVPEEKFQQPEDAVYIHGINTFAPPAMAKRSSLQAA